MLTALLLFSGDVITTECFEKLIKKDMIHPLTGKKLKEKDIITLQRVNDNWLLFTHKEIFDYKFIINFKCCFRAELDSQVLTTSLKPQKPDLA